MTSDAATERDQVARVRRLGGEAGFDAVVAMSPANVTYLTGFEVPSQTLVPSRLAFAIVTPDGDSCQVVVNMEESLTRRETPLERVVSYTEFAEHPIDAFAETLREMVGPDARVGIELDYISASDYDRLRKQVAGIELLDASAFFAGARIIKTAAEIDAIRTVSRMAHAAHYAVLAETRVGDTELKIASRVITYLLEQGAEHVLRLIIGSGDRSWHANPAPTARPLASGDMLRMDIFAAKGTYVSDVARTAVVGKPVNGQVEIWKHMLEFRQIAFDLLRPGASTNAIYESYRRRVEEHGYTPINFLGHGLGIELHEKPYLDRFSDVPLEPGMVLALEPYVMLPDRNWGFQIEDTVVITEDGFERLTDFHPDDELIAVDA
jgi:Xaa-Pro aminopeptidase